MSILGRLGISVAILAAFSALLTKVLQPRAFYQENRWAICAGLLGVGMFLWIVGKFVNIRLRESRTQKLRDQWAEDGQVRDDASDPFILVNLAYWGVMLAIFGVAVIVIPHVQSDELPVAAATVQPPVEKKVAPATTNAQPELTVESAAQKRTLPTNLKLQGIIYKTTNASALINGRTYFVGDTVGNATVVSIEGQKAVLELDGQIMVLELPR